MDAFDLSALRLEDESVRIRLAWTYVDDQSSNPCPKRQAVTSVPLSDY
jgi:hypothetical protein